MKTLVIGASENPERYSFKAIERLRAHAHEVIAFGPKPGSVSDVNFETEWNSEWQVETVTLYLGAARQEEYIDKIIALNPKRIIFNPGTENEAFFKALKDTTIFSEVACTLVLLATNEY
jgi:uncharacterized protein